MSNRRPSIIVWDRPERRVFWRGFLAESDGTIMGNDWVDEREAAAEFYTAREADNALRTAKRLTRYAERRYVQRRPTSDNRRRAAASGETT